MIGIHALATDKRQAREAAAEYSVSLKTLIRSARTLTANGALTPRAYYYSFPMRQDGHVDYTSQVFDSSTLSVEMKRQVQVTDFSLGLVASLGRMSWIAGLVSSKNWAWKKTWTAMVY